VNRKKYIFTHPQKYLFQNIHPKKHFFTEYLIFSGYHTLNLKDIIRHMAHTIVLFIVSFIQKTLRTFTTL